MSIYTIYWRIFCKFETFLHWNYGFILWDRGNPIMSFALCPIYWDVSLNSTYLINAHIYHYFFLSAKQNIVITWKLLQIPWRILLESFIFTSHLEKGKAICSALQKIKTMVIIEKLIFFYGLFFVGWCDSLFGIIVPPPPLFLNENNIYTII